MPRGGSRSWGWWWVWTHYGPIGRKMHVLATGEDQVRRVATSVILRMADDARSGSFDPELLRISGIRSAPAP